MSDQQEPIPDVVCSGGFNLPPLGVLFGDEGEDHD